MLAFFALFLLVPDLSLCLKSWPTVSFEMIRSCAFLSVRAVFALTNFRLKDMSLGSFAAMSLLFFF